MTIRSPWPSLRPYPRVAAWELLARAASRHPERVALVDASGTVTTYAELLAGAFKAACFLQRRANLRKGETVALVGKETRDTVALIHGILMVGGTLTTFNDSMSSDEIAARLADSEAAVVFAPDPTRQLVDTLVANDTLPGLRALYVSEGLWETVQSESGTPEPVPIDPDVDVGALAYTSGTGGLPKGVVLTHANLNAAALQWWGAGVGGPDSTVLNLRVFWSTSRRLVASGATSVVVSRLDPDEVLFLVEKYRVTQLLARPHQLSQLAAQQTRSRRDVSSLEYVESTSVRLPDAIARNVNKAFSCGVRQGYHLSEAHGSANVTLPGERDWRTVGQPVPDTEERIVDPATGGDVPSGSEGELLIRGPQVMREYWRCPEATESAFLPGGWLRTGDLARQDADGKVYIVDRIKEVIRVYGLPVVPAQLEAILLDHPAVREAAVVPVPDRVSGEAPKAFVVLEPGARATEGELLGLLRERLVHRKRLTEVEFVESLPRNESGKLLRRELVERERARRRGYRGFWRELRRASQPTSLRAAAAQVLRDVRRYLSLS